MPAQLDKVHLSDNEVRGFVNLLLDSEESTLQLMAQQIAKFDDYSLKEIEELVGRSEDDALEDNWYYASKISLVEQIQNWKRGGDLESGLFLISRLKNSGVDVGKYRAILDSYADRVASCITSTSSSQEIINVVNRVIFVEEGYVGNQLNYYDLANNFLHTVIDGKMGNPIMLSCIYILIAKRLDLDVRGIGTPGHFIIKFEDQYLDPFFSGKEITKHECIMRSQELNVYWRDEYLEPIDDSFIIARCIRNLIAIYKKQNEYKKAADATNLLKLV